MVPLPDNLLPELLTNSLTNARGGVTSLQVLRSRVYTVRQSIAGPFMKHRSGNLVGAKAVEVLRTCPKRPKATNSLFFIDLYAATLPTVVFCCEASPGELDTLVNFSFASLQAAFTWRSPRSQLTSLSSITRVQMVKVSRPARTSNYTPVLHCRKPFATLLTVESFSGCSQVETCRQVTIPDEPDFPGSVACWPLLESCKRP